MICHRNRFAGKLLRCAVCAGGLVLRAALAICVIACLSLDRISYADRDESVRPNIVFFLVDDMGVMDSSVPFLTDEAGKPNRHSLNKFYRTPNLEILAANGIRFSNFCAMSVCSPTRISILTGQHAARHRTTNWINPDENNRASQGPPAWNWSGLTGDSVTLPRLLQAAGYRTIHIGKAHLGPRDTVAADPLNLGFDVNVAGCSIGHPGSYYGRDNFSHRGQKKQALPNLEKYHGTDTFLTAALTYEAKTAVTDAVAAEQPFFLHFAHYAVHSPFQSDPQFADEYQSSDKSSAAQAYATLIEGIDQSLGALMSHLDELGVAEETLVFFLGDNGSDAPLGEPHDIACAAPLRGKKGTHYEGGMRVPFVASWAKPDPNSELQQRLPIAAEAIQPQLAAVYDLLPTVIKLVDLETPAGLVLDGSPLQTLLTGQADEQRSENFLMHYPHEHRSSYFTSFRNGNWKVVYHYFPSEQSGGARYELFDLDADPSESTNLASRHSGELLRMMNEMVAKLAAMDACYPVSPDDASQAVSPRIPEDSPN